MNLFVKRLGIFATLAVFLVTLSTMAYAQAIIEHSGFASVVDEDNTLDEDYTTYAIVNMTNFGPIGSGPEAGDPSHNICPDAEGFAEDEVTQQCTHVGSGEVFSAWIRYDPADSLSPDIYVSGSNMQHGCSGILCIEPISIKVFVQSKLFPSLWAHAGTIPLAPKKSVTNEEIANPYAKMNSYIIARGPGTADNSDLFLHEVFDQ